MEVSNTKPNTEEGFNWEADTWSVLKTMMTQPKFLIQHQINSINYFLESGLANIVEQWNPIILNYDWVANQQFFRLNPSSKYIELIEENYWREYKDNTDILKFYKKYINTAKSSTVKKLDLNQQLKVNEDKDTKLQKEFEEFLEKELEFRIIENINTHRYDLEIEIKDHSLSPPNMFNQNGSQRPMYPNEARLKSATYQGDLYAKVVFTCRERFGEGLKSVKEFPKQTLNKVKLGRLPIMLGSRACILSNGTNLQRKQYEECAYDEGGYFIINGSEKVLISQERQAENKAYVFKNPKSQAKYSHDCEVKSLPARKVQTPKSIHVKLTSKETIYGKNIKVTLPHIKQDVPLFIMFKVLGITADEDIVRYILYNVPEDNWREYTECLRASLEEASTIKTQQEAKDYLTKNVNMMGYHRDKDERDRRLTYLNDIIRNDFLPHLGDNPVKKAYYLGYMVKKLLDVYLNKREQDDRDSYGNKRIDTAGVLMGGVFRQYYTKMIKDMKTAINKEFSSGSWRATNDFSQILNNSNISKLIKNTTITTGLKFALATGNWGLKNNMNKQGIAQVLSRLTFNSGLSHLRRLNTPMEKTSKLVPPRKLHGTQIYYICPAETPEGGGVGLVKNLALSANITNYSDIQPIRDYLEMMGVKKIADCEPNEITNYVMIFTNGDWEYVTDKPLKIIDELKKLRRQGIIHIHTSIVWKMEENAIEIYTDAGRCTRPLYRVEDNQLVINKKIIEKIEKSEYSWNNLLTGTLDTENLSGGEAVIEYIDPQEMENCMVAITGDKLKPELLDSKVIKYKYTHCEIHPALITGAVASIIPFCDHNQSPRNCYQCLAHYEKVLMADGQWKQIKDIMIGDEVISFNPETFELESTKVINHYVRETENSMHEIETYGGRKLHCTGNHPFITPSGWRECDKLDIENDVIGIYDSNNKNEPVCHKVNDQIYFTKIKSIKPIEKVLISDITTESENHSFVTTNGFMVHNSSMGKQAIGMFATNFLHRMDTLAHVLCYPQKPLTNSRIMDYLPSNELPSGINCVVAIASYSGFNQDDSIMMNKSAIERGLFNSYSYHTFKDEEKKRTTSNSKMKEKFCRPEEGTLGTKGKNYNKIDEDGIPIENMRVGENDVIIGKVHPIKAGKDNSYMNKDCSTVVKTSEGGFIDKTIVSRNGDGYKFVKVRIRELRRPTVGDKHACYTPDHDVLTIDGWKPISEITVNEKVATLVNDRLVYQNPVEVMKYTDNTEIMGIISNDCKKLLRITLNHRVFYSYNNQDYISTALEMLTNCLGQKVKMYGKSNEKDKIETYEIDIILNKNIRIYHNYEPVYCCRVPEGEGLIYIRNGNNEVWCGNSRHG